MICSACNKPWICCGEIFCLHPTQEEADAHRKYREDAYKYWTARCNGGPYNAEIEGRGCKERADA